MLLYNASGPLDVPLREPKIKLIVLMNVNVLNEPIFYQKM